MRKLIKVLAELVLVIKALRSDIREIRQMWYSMEEEESDS